ncbi:hypothetical protein P43SY_006926 [Pythium insidiosum]|uniref:Uncharacterized protein n=1 Tax=Pythium insidiosum TaxID=114742 RepID=A0AAD5QCU1_PYTIN|nr:hypothetical protein P43SY_006926 [Pythium insidiosum]
MLLSIPTTQACIILTPARAWKYLFGIDGIFGVNGKYFDQFFQVREVLEILLQSYQLYYLSHAIPERWINSLAVSVVVLNCFGVVLLDTLPGFQHKERRLGHLLLDITLDLTCAVVIPLCIIVPYLLVVDWSTGVVPVNCYRDGTEGSVADLTQQLARVERTVLTKLIITHCPALVMPPILSEFSRLQSLETYNCTLVDWPMNAALRQQKHPALSYVYLMETDMSAFPTGLLHSEVPATFNNFRIYRSNLSVLPESLGQLWANQNFYAFALERTDVSILPRSLRLLQSFAYHILSNPIVEIPDDMFADARPGWLWLSGNPLRRLPSTIGDTSRLEELLVEWTNVTESMPWLLDWLAARSTEPFVSFYGSPICFRLSDPVNRYCSWYQESDTSSLQMEYVIQQRPL